MLSVCLPSDALSQGLPSYLGFSYLGHGVSLHGCSSKAKPLLLTLDVGYVLRTATPDLGRWVFSLCRSQLLRHPTAASRSCAAAAAHCSATVPSLAPTILPGFLLPPLDHQKSKRIPEKASALLTMPKLLTVWITINCGKF